MASPHYWERTQNTMKNYLGTTTHEIITTVPRGRGTKNIRFQV